MLAQGQRGSVGPSPSRGGRWRPQGRSGAGGGAGQQVHGGMPVRTGRGAPWWPRVCVRTRNKSTSFHGGKLGALQFGSNLGVSSVGARAVRDGAQPLSRRRGRHPDPASPETGGTTSPAGPQPEPWPPDVKRGLPPPLRREGGNGAPRSSGSPPLPALAVPSVPACPAAPTAAASRPPAGLAFSELGWELRGSAGLGRANTPPSSVQAAPCSGNQIRPWRPEPSSCRVAARRGRDGRAGVSPGPERVGGTAAWCRCPSVHLRSLCAPGGSGDLPREVWGHGGARARPASGPRGPGEGALLSSPPVLGVAPVDHLEMPRSPAVNPTIPMAQPRPHFNLYSRALRIFS